MEEEREIMREGASPQLNNADQFRKEPTPEVMQESNSFGQKINYTETLELLRQMEMRQIELEKQNKELLLEIGKARKIVEIYNSIPTGCFTADTNGTICELNNSAANFLNEERTNLIGLSLKSFISDDSPTTINDFFRNVFELKTKQIAEVTIETRNRTALSLHLEGICTNDAETCFITAIDVTECKRTEEVLKENNLTLLDLAPDAFFQGDLNGRLISVNDKATELTGYSKAELLSLNMLDLFPPDVLNFKPLRYDLLKNGDTIIIEREVQKKNGERIQIEMNSKIMPNATYQCFMRDITERKLHQKTLQESEARHRMLADNAKDIIWTMDLEGRFTYVSPSVEKLRGFTASEVMEQTLDEVLTPESALIAKTSLYATYKAVKENEPILELRQDLEQRCKDGSTVWTEVTCSGIYSESGEFIAILGVTRDITDRKRSDALLKASEEKFKQLIENSFDMIVLIDVNGIQQFVSESCEKILGFRPEELINIPVIEQMIHPKDQAKVIEAFQNATNVSHGGLQYRHRHKNGTWIYLEAFGTNQMNNPFVNAFVLNVRDITERKIAEKALRKREALLNKLNATKDKFFSIIAHDLRGPFHSIIGFSDILIKRIEEEDHEEIDRYANFILNSSQRALNMLMNLLDWSRSQIGRMEFCPEPIKLIHLVKEVTTVLEDSAIQKSINIFIQIPGNLIVVVDKPMVETILRNLISNAIKFTHPGGEVIISAEQNEGKMNVTVADNGLGIRKDAISKLFRIDENYTKLGTQNEKGTGLGLILCKEFIRKHKGRIWVESEEGKGSEFHFTIPNIYSEKEL